MAELRTLVTFRSTAFNTTQEREYFINPGNFGDDLGRWLMEELQSRSVEVDEELGQEDHGWYLGFRCGDTDYHLVVGHCDDTRGEWIGWIERNAGFLASLLGQRRKGIQPDACRLIHDVLAESERVSEVRWHFEDDYSAGREEAGVLTPA